MRFWDASAVIPLLTEEPTSAALWKLASADPDHAVWWGTAVECVSALARRRRLDQLSEEQLGQAVERLRLARDRWIEIAPTEELRTEAMRLLRVYPLRAGDACQLAAALEAAGSSDAIAFVSLDDRLSDAARREGFQILP